MFDNSNFFIFEFLLVLTFIVQQLSKLNVDSYCTKSIKKYPEFSDPINRRMMKDFFTVMSVFLDLPSGARYAYSYIHDRYTSDSSNSFDFPTSSTLTARTNFTHPT